MKSLSFVHWLTFQDSLKFIDILSLVSTDKISHCRYLLVILVAVFRNKISLMDMHEYVWQWTYGFVSWESKGLICDSVSIFASTRYLHKRASSLISRLSEFLYDILQNLYTLWTSRFIVIFERFKEIRLRHIPLFFWDVESGYNPPTTKDLNLLSLICILPPHSRITPIIRGWGIADFTLKHCWYSSYYLSHY